MPDFGEIAVRKDIASDTAWAFLAVVLAAVRGLGGGRPLPWTLDVPESRLLQNYCFFEVQNFAISETKGRIQRPR